MLEIINQLAPFIEDCYAELGVREYSRILKISPPTASINLKQMEKDGLLKKRQERRYLLFRADINSSVLIDLSRIYWKQKLNSLVEHIESELYPSAIILFGSLAKLEAKKDSDIDIAVIVDIKKNLNLEKYEKLYKREIQLFSFASLEKINKELRDNILNGYIIKGKLK